jgi:recombination protein RecR
MKYPQAIEHLVRLFTKLPGVGRRTAERYAFDVLIRWKEAEVSEFQEVLAQVKNSITTCGQCGVFTDAAECPICLDRQRRQDLLCVVASAREVYSLENTKEYRGQYHVLQGLLSPLDGRGEEILGLAKLIRRIEENDVKEVVVALDSTLEGDATALFIKQKLEDYPVKVSRLAFGIPLGSALEYVDGGTLARAFVGRAIF